MKITFTGRKSQIGEYFNGKYNFVSYDLFNPQTWDPLFESDVIFMLFPKNKETLNASKKFIVRAMDSNIRHIIKIGSLGPWRLIHNQIDTFLRESGIPYTSFDIAPLMNNIFTEQYIADTRTLLNYRGDAPAPYLDPVCLASAIEQCIDVDRHKNKNYKCTGNTQYTIDQVRDVLNAKGFTVDRIESTSNVVLHNLSDSHDEVLMKQIGNRYITEGWFPPVSSDLSKNFMTQARSLEDFIDQDKNIFMQRFSDDKSL